MQHKNLIISIPKEIKNKIDAEFGKEYSKAGLEKIYFLYFKINKENNNYQVNSTNHTWFYGFKNRGELGQILHRLVNKIFILKISESYTIGYKSNTYSLMKPYDYKNENCYRINYYDGQVKFPMWVQKYVADGGIVKNRETTNWIKDAKNSTKSESNKDIEIKQLKAEIERLQGLLSKVDTTGQANDTAPVIASNEMVFQPVVSNEFSKNKIEDVTPDIITAHEAELHENVSEIDYSFTFSNEKFVVKNWNKLLENKDADVSMEEIYEEIYDCNTHKPESIFYGNVTILKHWDFNDNINYVEVA
ncbi:hypothetical protein [Pedobacter nyackensis]|uniref:hypothetical protein n=1 Tax=Pedobacter nyackensis TaxID=475255 RepID=UPI0029309B1A|nr:hypothetical protein [Pedobacter nyackensis]